MWGLMFNLIEIHTSKQNDFDFVVIMSVNMIISEEQERKGIHRY